MVFDGQKKTLIIILLAIVVALMSILLIYSLKIPEVLEHRSYFAVGEIGEKVGATINSTDFNFGRVPRGSAAQKEFEVGNTYEIPIVVEVSVFGNIKDFVKVTPNNVEVLPGETKTFYAQFDSGNSSYGNYSGEIRISLLS